MTTYGGDDPSNNFCEFRGLVCEAALVLAFISIIISAVKLNGIRTCWLRFVAFYAPKMRLRSGLRPDPTGIGVPDRGQGGQLPPWI